MHESCSTTSVISKNVPARRRDGSAAVNWSIALSQQGLSPPCTGKLPLIDTSTWVRSRGLLLTRNGQLRGTFTRSLRARGQVLM